MGNETCIIILLWKSFLLFHFIPIFPNIYFPMGFHAFPFFFSSFHCCTAVVVIVAVLFLPTREGMSRRKGNELNKINFREKQSFLFFISNLCENKMKKRRRKGKRKILCQRSNGKKKQKEKGQEKWILVMKAMTKKCISISKVAWQRRKIMANKGKNWKKMKKSWDKVFSWSIIENDNLSFVLTIEGTQSMWIRKMLIVNTYTCTFVAAAFYS